MEIYKIISDIMRNQNLSVADIAKKSNLPDSTVRGRIQTITGFRCFS